MRIQSRLGIILSALTMLFLLNGCSSVQYQQVEHMATIKVEFVDPQWNGKLVPEGQQCNKFGGQGSTPELRISNIPREANAIIMEYSDKDARSMDNGGHGKLGYRLEAETRQVTIPPVEGHSFELPDYFFLVKPHANPAWDLPGAYLPPCSGGKGNRYYVTVKVVYMAPEGEQSLLLGHAKLNLGRY